MPDDNGHGPAPSISKPMKGFFWYAHRSPVVSVIGFDSVQFDGDRKVPEISVERAMSNASPQPVSVLSAAKNGLVYLTPNDWALIVDKAVRMQFKAGDTIVHKG